jgi:hypothetical protein
VYRQADRRTSKKARNGWINNFAVAYQFACIKESLMQLQRFLLFVMAAFGQLVLAQHNSDPAPEWTTACNGVRGMQEITARSASGDPTNDDMNISVYWTNHDRSKIRLPPAWYLLRPTLSKRTVGCEGIGVVDLQNGSIALLLMFNGRPGWNHVAVALLDPNKRAVLDVISDVGEVAEDFEYSNSGNNIYLAIQKGRRFEKDRGEEGVPSSCNISVIHRHLIKRNGC